MAFEINDTVEIVAVNDGSSILLGQTGTIVTSDDNVNYPYEVDIEGLGVFPVAENEIQKR